VLKARVAELEKESARLNDAIACKCDALYEVGGKCVALQQELAEARSTRDAAQAQSTKDLEAKRVAEQQRADTQAEIEQITYELGVHRWKPRAEEAEAVLASAQGDTERLRLSLKTAVTQLHNVMSGAGPTSGGVLLLHKDRNDISRIMDDLRDAARAQEPEGGADAER
jgi:chromosome segregation ATPase